MRHSRSSVVSAALSLFAIVALVVFVYFRDSREAILFDQTDTQASHDGAGRELLLQPVDPLALSDSRIHYAMLVAAVLAAVAGSLLSVRQYRKGEKDYFGASGLSFGVIGLVWAWLIVIGAV